MNRRRLSLIVNCMIAVGSCGAWLWMMFRAGNGSLSSRGFSNLKYFTVLSNLLQGAVSAVFAGWLFRRGEGRVPEWMRLLRYASATSVMLTFWTVMLFLGPLYGYPAMLEGANLPFHLLLPLLAAADFMAVDRTCRYAMKDSIWAIVPMLVYAIGYVANLLINGVGEWPNTNDWYGFARGGADMAAVMFVIMTLATWLIALTLRLPRRARRNK